MKARFDIILSCTAIVCVAVCVGIGLEGGHREAAAKVCSGIRVTLLDSARNHNLAKEHIITMVDRDFGGYVNRPVDSVNLFRIEEILSRQKCLESCEAYFTSDGILNIDVTQSTPVMKVCCPDSSVNYLNCKGETFPVGKDWCPDIPSVNRSVMLDDPQWARRLAALAGYIGENASLKERICSISCNSDGDITLRMKNRRETFEFGQPTGIADKFDRIDIYLRKISHLKEYNTVSLKNKGQIVCK